MPPFEPAWFLEQEARALKTRLDRVKPFVLQETMVPAAALLPDAQVGIERALITGRRQLRLWAGGDGNSDEAIMNSPPRPRDGDRAPRNDHGIQRNSRVATRSIPGRAGALTDGGPATRHRRSYRAAAPE